MNKDIAKILFTADEIEKIVSDMAKKIDDDFKGKDIVAVIVLKGSFIFGADLVRKLKSNVYVDFIQASSYGSQTVSSGLINIKKDIGIDISGKNVLIIEDIVDSGRTLMQLKKNFKDRKAETVKIATFLSKPSRRVCDVDIEYVGAEIPDEFVVGYGLDYDENYRQLEYIGILKREVYSK